MRMEQLPMIQHIKTGELYWADVDGKATKVRVVERSKELPHLLLCSDSSGKYIVVRDTAFHRNDDLKKNTGSD